MSLLAFRTFFRAIWCTLKLARWSPSGRTARAATATAPAVLAGTGARSRQPRGASGARHFQEPKNPSITESVPLYGFSHARVLGNWFLVWKRCCEASLVGCQVHACVEYFDPFAKAQDNSRGRVTEALFSLLIMHVYFCTRAVSSSAPEGLNCHSVRLVSLTSMSGSVYVCMRG